MNEVRMSTPQNAQVARLISSQGNPVQPNSEISLHGASPQVEESNSIPKVEPITPEEKQRQIESAVTSMAEYVQSIKRDLQFSVDEDTGRTVVKVLDSHTGDLIRQIPDQTFLELARKLKESGDVQFFDALG
jgi:flagellar protein FlaG